MGYFVNALAIRRWASVIEARYALPNVIRRLVLATVTSPTVVDFPAYESAQRSGVDGEIECDQGNPWVPIGRSVWEMGVNNDVKGKADEDFEKRTRDTPDHVRLATTYVALTPRHWENKAEWAAEQLKQGKWKDVRAYDADDLEQWAETAPATCAWLGRLLGVRPEGVDDIDAKWEMLSVAATKPLLAGLFLASRAAEVQSLHSWLSGQAGHLHITTRSPAEGLDFFVAYVASLDPAEHEFLAARAVVVESHRAWKVLRDAAAPAVLVVDPSFSLSPEEIARAVSRGHHVVTFGVRPVRPTGKTLDLRNAKQHDIEKVLRECGYSPVDSEQHARAAAGSLAILKRRLAGYAAPYTPDWLKISSVDALATALLLGGWDERNAADRQIIERLAGKAYEDLEPQFHMLARGPDPLLLHADHKWRVISKDEAWATASNIVPTSAFREFEQAAIDVLSDLDPGFDLPSEQSQVGHVSSQGYSATIKEHIAETLAMLGALSDRLAIAAPADVLSSVDRVVAKVLSRDAAWTRWASLGSRLMMLAEASPREFLRAVKADLVQSAPELLRLFEADGSGVVPRCNHAGLLWALELVAWSKQFLVDACCCLLSLDARDPGGQWANRPGISLREILRSWMPHTMASLPERIQLLDQLIQKDEKAAWSLLLQLLPGGHEVLTPTQKPCWRDWATEWQEGVSVGEMSQFVSAVAERLLNQCGNDSIRLVSLVERLFHLPPHAVEQLVSKLRSFAAGETDDGKRRAVFDSLHSQVGWMIRRERKDSTGKGPRSEDFAEVLDLVRPRSLAQQHAWLFESFSDYFVRLEDDIQAADKQLSQARADAIDELAEKEGFPGILALASVAEDPGLVGATMAQQTQDRFLDEFIRVQVLEGSAAHVMVHAYFAQRHCVGGWPWADQVLHRLESNDAKVGLLTAASLCRDGWERAEAEDGDVADQYWRRVNPYMSSQSPADLEHALQGLMRVGRVVHAIQLVRSALHKKAPISSLLLCRLLEAFAEVPADQIAVASRHHLGFEIVQVLTELQERDDIEMQRMVDLEMQYLTLLTKENRGDPRTLQQQLSSSPALYVEALRLAYRPRHDDAQLRAPATAEQRAIAQRAGDLLRSFTSLPGTNGPTVDESTFRNWCTDVRRLAENADRLDVCDYLLGQLMANAPSDADGSWPCLAVRQVIELVGTESLASGLHCGVINSRGMVCRGEGGAQERELVKKYEALAERVRFTHPVTVGVLDGIAKDYEFEGKHWDEYDRWEDR